jgi:putative phosphoribosyl transferase
MASSPLPHAGVVLEIEGRRLHGDLNVPEDASGLVVFAHGSGSSRRSPRNRQVAAHLNDRRLATLLFVEALAGRLEAVTAWTRREPGLDELPVGYFGASTGAAAALIAAADMPSDAGAVVSRGGRPDLAANRLPHVRAPTLLIVGGADVEVLRLNQRALELITAPAALEVVPAATHLFEEPGALERVAELSANWFTARLA